MIYREARSDDADRIAALHAANWRQAYRGILRDDYLDGDVLSDRQALWVQRMRNAPSNQYVVVAEDGDELAGFACLYVNEDATWGSMLDNLHVRIERRGGGIGAQLIKHMAIRARDTCSSPKLFLWVFAKNLPARRFYEGLGATSSETIKIDAPGGGKAIDCRYTWADAGALAARIDRADRK